MKKKRKEVHISEKLDGDYEGDLKSGRYEQQVRSKTGEDGIEETHISYVPRKKTKFFFIGEAYERIFKK